LTIIGSYDIIPTINIQVHCSF